MDERRQPEYGYKCTLNMKISARVEGEGRIKSMVSLSAGDLDASSCGGCVEQATKALLQNCHTFFWHTFI
jgi:hypothetical protein